LNPLQKNIALWLVISLVFVMIYHLFNQPKTAQMDIIYSDFLSYADKAQVTEVTIQGDNISGRLSTGKAFKTYAPKDAAVITLLKEKGVRISAKPVDDSPWYMTVLVSWLPMLLLIGVWIFFMRQMQGGGGKAMAFGKSRARLVTDKSKKVTFADVAGIEEAKAELQEVIDFLRDPKKYTHVLGGGFPKDCCLWGSQEPEKPSWRELSQGRRTSPSSASAVQIL
jgi:cell division protease FtsH